MISMERSLYDDQAVGDFQKPPASLYLELEHTVKRETPNYLLGTPDTRTFPLSTPEVATLLTSTGSTTTTHTPSPSRFLNPCTPVTEEQEMYAQGFLDALDQLHHHPSQGKGSRAVGHTPLSVIHHHHTHPQGGLASSHLATGANPSLALAAPTYVTATLDFIPNIPAQTDSTSTYRYPMTSSSHDHNRGYVDSFSIMNAYNTPSRSTDHAYSGFSMGAVNHSASAAGAPVKPDLLRELQAVVPNIPAQEEMKVARKKARNRIAASKCRIRRLQRESDLQGKVRMLKEHNQELNNELNGLKEQIYNLKKALIQHMNKGCQVNIPEGLRLESLDSVSSE